MNKYFLRISTVSLLMLTLAACQVTITPTPAPAIATTAPPPIISTATNTATPKPTITSTPWPSGNIDTGMMGNLSIQGVVKDSLGKVAPNTYVTLTVYGAAGGGDIGRFAQSRLYTDETGSYSFDNIVKLEGGHYEIWFNGEHEYGNTYENSGYYIEANEIKSNVVILDVTVHAVTNSVFSGVIQYEDVNGSLKSFYSPPFTHSEPGHCIELLRGTPDNIEYSIGSEYGKIAGGTTEWPGLAGGTYYLSFIYRRFDGVLVRCNSPTFEIPSGETKHLEYAIRNCPPVAEPALP